MSLRGRDTYRFGPNYYAPVWKWEDDESAISAMFTNAAIPLNTIFGTIYFKHTYLNSSGVEQVSYVNCGLDPVGIKKDFMQLYEERKVAFPYFIDSDEGQTHSKNKMIGAINAVLDLNHSKYVKLAESMGFVYDPIENYNMVEEATDTKTPTGTSTKSHTIDAEQIGSIKISGVVDMTHTTIDQDATSGKYTINNLTIDANGSKLTKADGVSDIEAAKKANRNQDDIGVADGSTPTTRNYTTTMDSAAAGRLHDYTTTEGTTAQASYNNLDEQIPVMGEIQAGNPAFASYTDTESFDERVDTNDHELSRRGNIGVTTSQQMIEQERNIVRFSVVKEFFNDLNNELLLAVWD